MRDVKLLPIVQVKHVWVHHQEMEVRTFLGRLFLPSPSSPPLPPIYPQVLPMSSPHSPARTCKFLISPTNSILIEMHPESGNVTMYPEDCSQYTNRSHSDSNKALRRTSNFLFRSKKERKIAPFPLHDTPPSLSSSSPPGCRPKLADFLFSRPVDNVILAVIVAFSLLTFVSLSLEDIAEDYVTYVEVVELVLLVFFMVELMLKFYAVGMVRSI